MSKSRADDFLTWRRVGFALYSVSSDSKLYDAFVEFSKKSPKCKEDKITCKDIWNAAPKYANSFSINAIRSWARDDNKKEYFNIIRSSYFLIIMIIRPCKTQ